MELTDVPRSIIIYVICVDKCKNYVFTWYGLTKLRYGSKIIITIVRSVLLSQTLVWPYINNHHHSTVCSIITDLCLPYMNTGLGFKNVIFLLSGNFIARFREHFENQKHISISTFPWSWNICSKVNAICGKYLLKTMNGSLEDILDCPECL